MTMRLPPGAHCGGGRPPIPSWGPGRPLPREAKDPFPPHTDPPHAESLLTGPEGMSQHVSSSECRESQ